MNTDYDIETMGLADLKALLLKVEHSGHPSFIARIKNRITSMEDFHDKISLELKDRDRQYKP